MLENLFVKNVALIESAEISFKEGLNILSGETGAGKSMIIDSINFALGERVSKDFVRNGEKQAVVEALFKVSSNEYEKKFQELGLDEPEDGEIIISRTITSDGKTTNRINGRTVTVSMLKELAQSLVDFHGQHEHQSLLNPAKHIVILDKFCSEVLNQHKLQLFSVLEQYKEVKKDIEKIYIDQEDKNRKIDMLEFQIEEISQANLKSGEEEALNEKKIILANSEKLKKSSYNCIELLYDNEDGNATDIVAEAIRELGFIAGIDESLEDLYEQLNTASSIIEDVSRTMKGYLDSMDADDEDIDDIEERLNVLYNLKRKYGKTVEDILEFYEEKSRELELLINSDVEYERLNNLKGSLEETIVGICEKMTQIRQAKANEIKTLVENELKDLQMKDARFEISFDKKKEFSYNGIDKVEFMISTNVGDTIKPLSKIASGGEMSRIMLAMKNVLADADNIETFIFDEIDTGVSGRAAQKVGEKMAQIGKKHQILCITHLPQIASMANAHYLIEKNVENGRTTTRVMELDYTESINEVSRLMVGEHITETSFNAAKEMKDAGLEFNNGI